MYYWYVVVEIERYDKSSSTWHRATKRLKGTISIFDRFKIFRSISGVRGWRVKRVRYDMSICRCVDMSKKWVRCPTLNSYILSIYI